MHNLQLSTTQVWKSKHNALNNNNNNNNLMHTYQQTALEQQQFLHQKEALQKSV